MGQFPALYALEPDILANEQHYCSFKDHPESRERVAGRREMKYQQTLGIVLF